MPFELKLESSCFCITLPFLFVSFVHRTINPLINAAQLRYIKEAEEIRLAMQPLDLIKRVSLQHYPTLFTFPAM